jgi:hypothetical protein
MGAVFRQTKKLAQSPAHPKILFDAGGGQTKSRLRLFTESAAALHRHLYEFIHDQGN